MSEETPQDTPAPVPSVPPPPSRQTPPPVPQAAAPVQAKAPDPEPAPAPPQATDAATLAALEAARKAAEAAAEAAAAKVRELEAAQAKAANAELEGRRREFVARLGGLVDDAVWAAVPAADPATPDGQRALMEWFQSRPTLLRVPPVITAPPISDKQKAVQMAFGRVPQNAAAMLGPKP